MPIYRVMEKTLEVINECVQVGHSGIAKIGRVCAHKDFLWSQNVCGVCKNVIFSVPPPPVGLRVICWLVIIVIKPEYLNYHISSISSCGYYQFQTVLTRRYYARVESILLASTLIVITHAASATS